MSAAALTVVAAGASFADINPTNITPTITGAGPYTYTYGINVTNGETVTTGDFFTFVDVNGLVAGSETAQPNWTTLETATGPTATGASGSAIPAVDSAAITNVTFTYKGASPIVGVQDLGTFSFKSVDGPGLKPGAFTAVADLSGTALKNANLTTYLGPAVPSSVPEPASVVPFALGGLALLGLIVRKTRRTSGAAA